MKEEVYKETNGFSAIPIPGINFHPTSVVSTANPAPTVWLVCLFGVFLLLCMGITAGAQNFGWAKKIGLAGFDNGQSIATDDEGNVYFTGYSGGNVDFDPGEGIFEMNMNNGRIYICKLNSQGNFVWAKHWGGGSFVDEGTSVTLDGYGNVYITGFFKGTGDFDPGEGNCYLTSAGEYDIFINKLDTSGNFIWAKGLGGNDYEKAYAITPDKEGGVYITGYFESYMDFDPGPGTFYLGTEGDDDVFVLKLDASGEFVWAKSWGWAAEDRAYAIVVDDEGNVYTTGSFFGPVDFDPGPDTFVLFSSGFSDSFISKLDKSGNLIWARAIAGTDEQSGYSIAADSRGNVYTTGFFTETADFDPGPNTLMLNSSGRSDGFLCKLDPDGKLVWVNQFGGEQHDSGQSVALDAYNTVYLTGMFSDTIDFDPGNGTFLLSSFGQVDAFIAVYTPGGNFVWAGNMGGFVDDAGYSVAVDKTGNIYSTGNFDDTTDFDPGAGVCNLISSGSGDIFIHKMIQPGFGVEMFNTGAEVVAYPNPTDGRIIFETFQAPAEARVILRDIVGQVLVEKNYVSANVFDIFIPGPPGIYLAEIIFRDYRRACFKIVRK
ncbi:MAG: SBBP repeat-containing protein [Bacteroidales bacterium]|nr:SBBP repeat-containing protein [Bacteroidales bacterium]